MKTLVESALRWLEEDEQNLVFVAIEPDRAITEEDYVRDSSGTYTTSYFQINSNEKYKKYIGKFTKDFPDEDFAQRVPREEVEKNMSDKDNRINAWSKSAGKWN